MFKPLDKDYLLRLGLALGFLANGLAGLLTPNEIKSIIEQSLIFGRIVNLIPFFPFFIGLNDSLLCLLILFKVFPKIVAIWATLWITGVILVVLSSFSFEGLLAAYEHAAYLVIGIHLYIKTKEAASMSLGNGQANS